MLDISVVIVDDSAFSIAYIKGILEKNGLNVVGKAGTLEEVIEVVKATRPQLVTMDITLPGTDGLECTRAIHEIDKNIKVVVVSSMMDDEIVKAAKKNKVAAYIQKPVDANKLMAVIQRVMAIDDLYHFLLKEYANIFKETMLDGINKLTKTLVNFKDEHLSEKEYPSRGLTIIVGIIGKFSGRMLVDLDMETARKITIAIMNNEPHSKEEVIAVLGELTNIVSGNACSILNRIDNAYGLRVAPPTITRGESVHISSPGFQTTSTLAETEYGDILLNVGFKRGDDHWT
jgi:DNA-binding NarL/FixJ family response regulator